MRNGQAGLDNLPPQSLPNDQSGRAPRHLIDDGALDPLVRRSKITATERRVCRPNAISKPCVAALRGRAIQARAGRPGNTALAVRRIRSALGTFIRKRRNIGSVICRSPSLALSASISADSARRILHSPPRLYDGVANNEYDEPIQHDEANGAGITSIRFHSRYHMALISGWRLHSRPVPGNSLPDTDQPLSGIDGYVSQIRGKCAATKRGPLRQ
jgi:hypothetical protein